MMSMAAAISHKEHTLQDGIKVKFKNTPN